MSISVKREIQRNQPSFYWIDYQKKIMGIRLKSGKIVPVESYIEEGVTKYIHPETGKAVSVSWL